MARQKRNQLGRALAVTGGGALVVWLLWRGGVGRGGRGEGLGGGRGEVLGGTGDGHAPDAKASGAKPAPTPAPTSVRIRVLAGERVQLEEKDVDLATAIERARSAGRAVVTVTGDAREGWAVRVLSQLRMAGVDVLVHDPAQLAGDRRVAST